MSSTNFTVPKGVKKIDCFCVGGGEGGKSSDSDGGGSPAGVYAGNGGSGGYATTVLGSSVTPGQVIPIVVGAGGTSTRVNGNANGSWWWIKQIRAGDSTIGSICKGEAGNAYIGGSGGGWGVNIGYFQGSDIANNYSTDGGSDGSDGETPQFNAERFNGMPGQHTTTRYFGESTGTLYAGGGGGGGLRCHPSHRIIYKDSEIYPGRLYSIGGAGGGGNGRWYNMEARPFVFVEGTAGGANTGGGGGGGDNDTYSVYTAVEQDNHPVKGYDGGSGICIIRWTKDYFK